MALVNIYGTTAIAADVSSNCQMQAQNFNPVLRVTIIANNFVLLLI